MELRVRSVVVLLACVAAAQAKNATRVLLDGDKDAVCLDGSAPGYYMRPGQDKGSEKWIVHLMGGGWCDKGRSSCLDRSLTKLGSTKSYPESMGFQGFLSDDPNVNPDFHDWNMVFVIYCDGGSFAGDRKEPDVVNGTSIYYRGYHILQAIIANLKAKGMSMATDVILTGCSAGGLAVYMHADFVHSQLSPSTKFRAFADAGYFLDIPNVKGEPLFQEATAMLMEYQNINTALIPECKEKYTGTDMWKCMFAPYIYHYIKAPLFVLNSLYDTAQLSSIYMLPCLPNNCSTDNMRLFQHFNDVFLQKIQPVLSSSSANGYYFDSCLVHCQTLSDKPWTTYSAKGHPLWESFGDWYYQRPSSLGATRVQDCKFPCNPTCPVSNGTA